MRRRSEREGKRGFLTRRCRRGAGDKQLQRVDVELLSVWSSSQRASETRALFFPLPSPRRHRMENGYKR